MFLGVFCGIAGTLLFLCFLAWVSSLREEAEREEKIRIRMEIADMLEPIRSWQRCQEKITGIYLDRIEDLEKKCTSSTEAKAPKSATTAES